MKSQKLVAPLTLALVSMLSASAWAGDHYPNQNPLAVDSMATANISDQQFNYDNSVRNNQSINTGIINGGTANNSAGNLGINVAGGENNQQANAVALSATDSSFVFGSATSILSARQEGQINSVNNRGSQNAATLSGALVNVSGNAGVNIAAGTSNQQKNDMAASTAVSRLANATVTVVQQSGHNTTTNTPVSTEATQYVPVSLELAATGNYHGISVPKDDHNGGHNRDSRSNNDHHSSFNYEAGNVLLQGTVTGLVPVVVTVNKSVTNQATLTDGALQGFKGNVGVNVAAGSGNQQYNGLAIAAAQAPRR